MIKDDHYCNSKAICNVNLYLWSHVYILSTTRMALAFSCFFIYTTSNVIHMRSSTIMLNIIKDSHGIHKGMSDLV